MAKCVCFLYSRPTGPFCELYFMYYKSHCQKICLLNFPIETSLVNSDALLQHSNPYCRIYLFYFSIQSLNARFRTLYYSISGVKVCLLHFEAFWPSMLDFVSYISVFQASSSCFCLLFISAFGRALNRRDLSIFEASTTRWPIQELPNQKISGQS